MGRTVSAVVTCGRKRLGALGPFTVDSAWWAEVGQVVAVLRRELGVPVLVLRLLHVDGGEGGRDGHVTYHVEAERPTRRLEPYPGDLLSPHRFRSPWATAEGLRELLSWARTELAARGRPVTGAVEQHRTWNLAGLFRLPTGEGPVWLKSTPHFATDEPAVIAAFARHDPTLVPTVLAAGDHRMLLEHLPGEDCWHATEESVASAVHRFVAVQATLAGARLPLPDRRRAADQVRALLDGPVDGDLTADERARARLLTDRWAELDDCGLPDTVVHGDFHPGNWRATPGGPPVVLDFADAHLGNPVLDGLRAGDYLAAPTRPAAARAWVDAWTEHRPGARPRRALRVAEPLAHLGYAVRYQEFLDGIEPSERVYHRGDPTSVIRAALRVAAAPSAWVG
ncbi:MAG: phosphotransferase [Actinophytocola sp.]|uniref:aminoglycoside phosphotransferase family protein n=1 Tax=Actinophytocola sp. TaxID=1872138 RepID=UPI001328F59F|nr:aminoglycoside phosphotransferase family protein [Actinophytocola sp.]MPZ83563.1 phosphotransferase [Actinophytocola sp.]